MGFLAGFIGSAPFAWGLLASQLESGAFVRGLWYFFGIVTAAGIFAGIAGLGLGFVGGMLWEQFHRHRRRERLKQKEIVEASTIATSDVTTPDSIRAGEQAPRLQLVGSSFTPLPDLAGRVLQSVRFFEAAVELDFGTLRIGLGPSAIVSCGTQRHRYPEPGSRDAICALIGERVGRVRIVSGERVEISYDSGCDITVPRNALAVA